MRTFAISTLGCKVNQYESRQIGQLLRDSALMPVQPANCPDLVVINTCCVTHTASAKSRQAIRKAQKYNPEAVIVVAGCLPAGQGDELKNIDGNLRIITCKNDLPQALTALVHSCHKNKTSTGTDNMLNNYSKPSETDKIKQKNTLPLLTAYPGQVRAFLKVQDGCDGCCSYCIIPQIRTNVCSKDIKSVLAEAAALVAAGHKEIVLTGIFLGAYGRNTVRRNRWNGQKNDLLADLLARVAQLPGLQRLRLSSLEPADVTDRLLDVFCQYPNIMPHLHLPLQSGSGNILKKMCRQYTVADFLKVVDTVKSRLDRPAITTDVIVGFPGETNQDFDATVAVVRSVAFAKTHVFSFSSRKNTSAAKMQPAVKSEVIKQRSAALRALDKQLQAEFRSRFIGEKVGVLVEQTAPDNLPQGRCERYFMVRLNNGKNYEKGQLVFTTLHSDI